MARRRGARKVALDILYEQEMGAAPLEELVDRFRSDPSFEYAETLVQGVTEHREDVDRLISGYAQGWKLERMPVIDRILLRLAIFEILFLPGFPAPVAINEAVELAKRYSTDDSSRFINGVLGRIVERESTRV
ncbi:MAG: transcription antitermination factor NusB [Actinomycetota bacterium]